MPITKIKKTRNAPRKKTSVKKQSDGQVLQAALIEAEKPLTDIWFRLHSLNNKKTVVKVSSEALNKMLSVVDMLRDQIAKAKEIKPPYIGSGFTVTTSESANNVDHWRKLYWKILDEKKEAEKQHDIDYSELEAVNSKHYLTIKKLEKRNDWYMKRIFHFRRKSRELNKQLYKLNKKK